MPDAWRLASIAVVVNAGRALVVVGAVVAVVVVGVVVVVVVTSTHRHNLVHGHNTMTACNATLADNFAGEIVHRMT